MSKLSSLVVHLKFVCLGLALLTAGLPHRSAAAERSSTDHPDAPGAQEVWDVVVTLERDRVVALAESVMAQSPVSLRDDPLPATAVADGVQPGDYYSMGDYWWPDPTRPDGLPYVQRDGTSNPDNFVAHRRSLRAMREAVAALTAAYLVTGDARFAVRAGEWLERFFVAAATRMHPHLRFAQAIPGRTTGRGIGIIDTLHLVEAARALEVLAAGSDLPEPIGSGARLWFSDYLEWMLTHPNGREEAMTRNNHSVAYWLQVAVFAQTVGNQAALAEARETFLQRLLPDQMAPDGSFPRELARTKPFGYSIFQLDNVCLLAEVLSTEDVDLWRHHLPDGRSLAQAVAFLYPFLDDPATWPYAQDIEHFADWPVRQPALLLASYRLHKPEYWRLWCRLNPDPTNEEVRRNMAVTQPLLWIPRPMRAPAARADSVR